MTEQDAIKTLAEQVLRDPMLLRQLSDRVYAIIIAELRYQRERAATPICHLSNSNRRRL